jgi:hypothetical protein
MVMPSVGRSQISLSPGSGGFSGAGRVVSVGGNIVEVGTGWGCSVVGIGVGVVRDEDEEQLIVKRIRGIMNLKVLFIIDSRYISSTYELTGEELD